jgi:hypothetical protein
MGTRRRLGLAPSNPTQYVVVAAKDAPRGTSAIVAVRSTMRGGCRWSRRRGPPDVSLAASIEHELGKSVVFETADGGSGAAQAIDPRPHLDPGPSNRQLLRKRGYGSRYDSDRKSSASDERRRDTTEQDSADRAVASGATDEHVDIVRAQGSQ